MKRFRDIIQDIKAPSTSDLWIDNGELKYYTSNGWKAIAGNGSSDVYTLPGTLQTTEEWFTTDVESIVGNWDEFTKAVSGGKVIVGDVLVNELTFRTTIKVAMAGDEVLIATINSLNSIHVYTFTQSSVNLSLSEILLSENDVIDELGLSNTNKPLSANQGKILNNKIVKLESKSNVAVLIPTGTKLMELVSSSPNVTQEQLAEAGFTPEICRRLNAGEVIYMSGECAGFGNDALYPIQGIAPNSSPDLVPSRLCYCHYSSYNADGTANGGCFTTIKKQSSVSTL